MIMNYDSLYSVSKAIAEKMGADGNKKYDSTYSVALEILNRMDSNASKLKSVNEFPTDNVKDGDVVYLKGNTDNADGFYVYSDGGWTMISGGSSTMKTYTLQTLVDGGTAGLSESDRASMLQSVKNGENFRIDIANAGYSFLAFGFYHTDTRAVVYFGFADTNSRYYRYSTDDDKVAFVDNEDVKSDLTQIISKLSTIEDILADGTVKFMDSVPTELIKDSELAVVKDGDEYNMMTRYDYVKKEFTDYTYDTSVNSYRLGATSSSTVTSFTLRYEFNIDGGTATIDAEMKPTSGGAVISNATSGTISGNVWTVGTHKYVFDNSNYEMKIDTYDISDSLSIHSVLTNLSGVFNDYGLNDFLQQGCNRTNESKNLQITPNVNGDSTMVWNGTAKFTELYENGKKLSEKYNPYNTTTAKTHSAYNTYYIPDWNEKGQIIGSSTFYIGDLTLNGVRLGRYIYTGVGNVRDWYAPTTSGTSGQVLQSNGDKNAPTWTDLIKIQKITQDAYDALETKDSNVLYVITDETA